MLIQIETVDAMEKLSDVVFDGLAFGIYTLAWISLIIVLIASLPPVVAYFKAWAVTGRIPWPASQIVLMNSSFRRKLPDG